VKRKLTVDDESESAENEVDHDEDETLLQSIGEECSRQNEDASDEVDGNRKELDVRHGLEISDDWGRCQRERLTWTWGVVKPPKARMRVGMKREIE